MVRVQAGCNNGTCVCDLAWSGEICNQWDLEWFLFSMCYGVIFLIDFVFLPSLSFFS